MLVLLAAVLAAQPPKSHPYDVNDQVAMKRLLDFKVPPDLAKVAYVLRTTDLEANRGRPALWLVNADGPGQRQLPTPPDSDPDPAFSPDGTSLYFLSTR